MSVVRIAGNIAATRALSVLGCKDSHRARGQDIRNRSVQRSVSVAALRLVEMGFMRALGKPVLGYSNDSTLFFDRAKDHLGGVDGHDEMGRPQAHGMALENFSMVDNLMLHGAVRHSGFDVIVGDVPDDELYTSLAVFEKWRSSSRCGRAIN